MKVALVLLVSAFVAVTASEPLAQCGGSCMSSASCASSSGDILCRCQNFVCTMTELCGGGCVTDSQCANWGGGDDKCVCSWFSCSPESLVKELAKNPRALFLQSIKARQLKQ